MSAAARPLKVIVAGGGIGGLAFALALDRALPAARVRVRVLEAAATPKALGVGINVQPSGVLALHRLGLQPALEAVAIETEELRYYTGGPGASLIVADPRGKHAGYAVPQYSIHRGDLQSVLLDAVRARLGADAVAYGHRVVRADGPGSGGGPHGGGATAVVETAAGGRHEERCDVLVAADGIHSAVRRQFYADEGAPVYAGLLLWRATTVMPPFLGGKTMLMAGTDAAKLVCYPVCKRTHEESGGRLSLVNWIAETRRPDVSVADGDSSARRDSICGNTFFQI